MSDIYLYNIQGFRGEFEYTIDDSMTVINSINNGVGKTTIFDCIKLTCNQKLLDKEEQEYMRNIREEVGVFAFTRNDVMHGFRVTKNKPTIFFRRIGLEETETSTENFPTAAQDIGILFINNMMVNMCGKDLNLFSSSGGPQNYQLVKTITTHQQTEDSLDLLQRSINVNEQTLSGMRTEMRSLEMQKDSLVLYLGTDSLDELLSDNNYENFEYLLSDIYKGLTNLKPVLELNFNSSIGNILTVTEELRNLQHTDYIKLPVEPVQTIQLLDEKINNLSIVTELNVDWRILESLSIINDKLSLLTPINNTDQYYSQTIRNMLDLYIGLHRLHTVSTEQFSTNTLTRLLSVYIRISTIQSTRKEEEQAKLLASKRREEVKSYRVECPIRSEVYLVDGLCHYE